MSFFILQFYAPWCAYCHTFEPIWHEVGAELKSMGSPVNVGKIDTTVHTSGFDSHVHIKVCILERFNFIYCVSKIIFKISKNCICAIPPCRILAVDESLSPAVAWFEMTVMVMPHQATA